MNTTASGTGVAAIRSLRDSPQKINTTTIEPNQWSKQELSNYVAKCGLQDQVSVLASLQADGQMLALLSEENMLKYAVQDQHHRAAIVACVRAACAGLHQVAAKWNVTFTLRWLYELDLPSFSKDNVETKKRARSLHGALLCQIQLAGQLQEVLQLSEVDCVVVATAIASEEELKMLSIAIARDGASSSASSSSSSNGSNDPVAVAAGDGGSAVPVGLATTGFSSESVNMPGPKKTVVVVVAAGANPPPPPAKDEDYTNMFDTQNSLAMLSTPRYDDDDSFNSQKMTNNVVPKLNNDGVAGGAGADTGVGLTSLVPLPQFQDESTSGENVDDGFFMKILWDRSDVLGRGAFGAVYKGFDAGSGCFVAVKELIQNNLEDLRMQVEEIRLLKNLIHPNVVS